MANIGAEVGQKMRSAIKAKLLELNCYVDDELPDYVMVMVANKRTKSQMKEDLQLFLAAKTGTFVDWLHIVLKKLKEVTVTNPEVYKKTVKRKVEEISNVNVKKEKKEKNSEKQSEQNATEVFKSLTDDLPISANRLSEQRKIIIMKEFKSTNSSEVMQDNFDIPLLSEVNMSTEEELVDIEKKIKNVKSRLGILVESDDEEDCINLKTEHDELFTPPSVKKIETKKALPTVPEPTAKPERTRITFNPDELEGPTKRKSVLDRLGKRHSDEEHGKAKKSRIILANKEIKEKEKDKGKRRSTDKPKEGILSRLGVLSKVSIPEKKPEEPEAPFKNREVPSMVKIKPRVIPHDAPQANKNLLLKAVAEAQRSIAQAPKVGNNLKPDAVFTKKYKEKRQHEQENNKKKSGLEQNNKKKIQDPATDDGNEKIVENIPTSENVRQQFIVTLDGLEKTKYKNLICEDNNNTKKLSVKDRLEKKKSPSPIIFDNNTITEKVKSNIPDKLPVIHAPPSIKNKERCKYWPLCRQGEKCEFVHPSTNCEAFPHCKFGDKCLYLHPTCKFGSSCTRRDCPYSHLPQGTGVASRIVSSSPIKAPIAGLQICKYFPNCNNANYCPFYHPKPCKFGKYCKNQNECTFSHGLPPNKNSLIWRSK